MLTCLTDTGERPFHCPHCKAGFQRPDVLAKHMEKLHREHGASTGPTNSQRTNEKLGNPRERERSRLACDQCRKRKLKCDNFRPCRSCKSKLLTCTVSSSSRPPGRPRNVEVVLVSPTDHDSMACQSSDLGNEREVNETVNEMNAVDSLLGPWTPNSIEPPSTLLTVRPHSSEPTNMTANTAAPDTYYGTSRTSITGTDQWIHVASEVASIPSTEAPFEAGAAYLQQTWDTMDFLNDLVPSAVRLSSITQLCRV